MQLHCLVRSCLILSRQKIWMVSKNIKKGSLKILIPPEVEACARLICCFSWLFLSVMQLYPYFKQLVSFFPPLQIEVVNTFKSGTSFQGALRRQSSVTSQTQDVTNISSPSHVSLSNALSSPTSTSAAAAGRECEFLLHPTLRDANLARVAWDSAPLPLPSLCSDFN